MNTVDEQRNPVEELAEEFAARRRRGERPTLQEYCDRHPELADEIRDLFPALAMIEDLDGSLGATTGSVGGVDSAGAGPRLERLGDYRILREIGRGGMGVVHEAEQESLGRRVALKVLGSQALSDPRQVRRFEREARAAARLHHTNIVPVFGVGCQDGQHYYVMQFISGQGLDLVIEEIKRLRSAGTCRERARPPCPCPVERDASPAITAAEVARSLVTGRFGQHGADGSPGTSAPASEPGDKDQAVTEGLPDESPPALPQPSGGLPGAASELSGRSESRRLFFKSVARIGIQAAEALEYANGQGVLHRDVKPSNLLLDHKGNVWVADFGLAKTAEADDLTHTGDILGTVRYMAPERFRGVCDVRSDVYSLGLTLYELVALRPAYQASDRHSLIERVLNEDPPSLRKLAPAVPRDLETIVAKAIAREPAQRYATAGALAEDLKRFVDDRPIRARRTGAIERAWRWSRRNKALAGLMASVAFLLIVVAVGSTLSAFQFRGMNRTLQGTNRTLESNLYFSDIDRAYRECLAENPGRAEHLLAGCPAHLRGWEWHYLRRLSHTALLTIPAHEDYVFNVAYSPDGKTLATSSQDGTARIFDSATGRRIHTLHAHDPDICWRVAYSPDGKMIASVGRDKTVRVWDAASGAPIRTLLGHRGTIVGVAYSPAGHLLASAGDDSMKVWDTKTWREIRTLPGGWYVAFRLDGRRLASVGAGLQVWDTAALDTGAGPIAPSWSLDGHFGQMAFSPDGRSIAIPEGGQADVVTILDAASGQKIRSILSGHANAIQDVAYSPDGQHLASASLDGTVKLWDAKSGGLLRTFRGHTERVVGVAFDPAGGHLASASLDGTVKLWDVTRLREQAVQEARTQADRSGHILGVVHSRDGRSFATIGGIETVADDAARVEAVTIWDSKTGQEVRTIPRPTAGVCHDVALDPGFGRVAWARGDGTVEIRDATTGQLLLPLSGNTDLTWRVAYSPDGRQLASASRDGTVRVWDAGTGRLIHILPGMRDIIYGLRFSPDGRRLALFGYKSEQLHPAEIKIWDAVTGQSLPTLGGYFEAIYSIAFHPREGLVACTPSSVIHILEMATGREILQLRGHVNSIDGLAFSPDGLRLASAGNDGTVKLWEPATGREILSLLHGKEEQMTGVSFSPDGRQIVSVSKGGTIKVWDATPLPEAPEAANGGERVD